MATGIPDSSGTAPAPRRISIGTITRNRPALLRKLFDSYLEMVLPENVALRFVIVENAAAPSLDAIIEQFRSQAIGHQVHYQIEPRLGIASARNCVLQYTVDVGDDLLAFIDDDEVVTTDWLVNLLSERDRSDLTIIGSPVRFEAPPPEISGWRKFIWTGLNKANLHSEAKARAKWESNEADRITLATGSWLADLEFFRRTSLRFDSSLGMAGGEDWRLCIEARRMGARTGWSPDAIVYEHVPLDRLTLGYQYRRARDTSMTLFGGKLQRNKASTLLKLPGSVLGRCVTLVLQALAIPFTRGESLVRVFIAAGNIVGVILACLGRKSAHYA